MADIFLSYSRADEARAGAVAGAIEGSGRSLWWDRRLASGQDYADVIEREIAAAQCVVVAWSKTARDSLWVRAEANEALDQEKLVQLNLDGAKLPLPFTMLHWLDLRGWSGGREQMPWPHVEARLETQLGGGGDTSGRRPDAGGIPFMPQAEPPLQGFGMIAALGWTALATALLVVLCVIMTARDLIQAQGLAVISVIALALAVGVLGGIAWIFLRVARGSRR